eukprot:CAMPEP_0202443576 /NCGR_PEP_ID=MMETSP1360-20130828/2796_1 /ASSEMBLY_ACC=CAM_ASM_000848 /TAXON_ID=515479 /ORGANISM="Licmophora paradoxa, Strain CCMP2313" /LENGTH=309 /DNA_ID=CAMNT_0049059299 /DNA_START=185 /DNA_END=1114 /DNA_ORIENTATION=-
MASAYTANLASFLVADRSPAFVPITLAEAEQSGVQVCVRADAAVFHQISAKYPALPLIVDPDFTKTYQMLREGKCQVLAARAADWSKFSRDALVNGDCQLQWIGRAEQINGGGAATKVDSGEYCTSILTHVLDIHFNEMIDAGFIEHAWNAHLDTLSSHNCANGETAFEIEEENDGRLRPVDVGGIFVIHGMCCFVAILLGVGERFRKRRRQQKRGLKKQDGIMNDHSGTDELELERMDGIASQPLSRTLADDHGDEREDDISVTPNYGEDDVMVEEAVAVLQQYLMKKRTGSRHISTSHGSRMSLEMR